MLKLSIARAPIFENIWVVWNVGQGQWVTHISEDFCTHYDVGGEIFSFQRIKSKVTELCYRKVNRIFLSHWDFDHYMNFNEVTRNFTKVCWLHKPELTKMNKSIAQINSVILDNCPAKINPIEIWIPLDGKSSNDRSAVALYDKKLLIPGDSTIRQEKIWSSYFSDLNQTKILVLGHHGSRTSTGEHLLNLLPNLKWTVASARFEKYHHPHRDVLRRLVQNNTPVLKTEDWGNIWFEP